MGRPTRMMLSIMQDVRRKFAFGDDVVGKPVTPEEELEQRRHELKNGLTDMQRLFLLGKLEGLNDKDAALAAGYSLSVSENTKQRIRKPKVREEFARITSIVGYPAPSHRVAFVGSLFDANCGAMSVRKRPSRSTEIAIENA
jgi:hypothetical protein